MLSPRVEAEAAAGAGASVKCCACPGRTAKHVYTCNLAVAVATNTTFTASPEAGAVTPDRSQVLEPTQTS